MNLHITALDLEGLNAEQVAFIEAHRDEYTDENVFADLAADYADELAELA